MPSWHRAWPRLRAGSPVAPSSWASGQLRSIPRTDGLGVEAGLPGHARGYRQSMRIVVIGATGNIGTALIEALYHRADDLELVGIARRLPDDEFRKGSRVTWRALDVARAPLDEALRGADVVVHLGWLFHPSHRPDETWQNNVVGTVRVLEAVQRCGIGALVCSSSVAAYSHRTDETPVDETWPTHGASSAPYVREKAYVERLLDTFEEQTPGCRLVRMRPAFVFHPRAAPQQRRLFMGPLTPGRLLRPGALPVLPVPAGLLLQTAHADDVGEAFAAAVLGAARGTFNICADEVLRPADLADVFESRVRTVPPQVFARGLAGAWAAHLVPAHPLLFDALMRLPVMSNTQAKERLDWHPRVSARDALGAFLVGLNNPQGHPTPPLVPNAGGRLRWRELATRVGGSAD